MYEKLKGLLTEWETYSNPKEEMPDWIRRKEKWSIGRSVELTLTEMRGTKEYESITDEDKKIIDIIYNFLVAEASEKNLN